MTVNHKVGGSSPPGRDLSDHSSVGRAFDCRGYNTIGHRMVTGSIPVDRIIFFIATTNKQNNNKLTTNKLTTNKLTTNKLTTNQHFITPLKNSIKLLLLVGLEPTTCGS
jgi:hypothetical protein